MLETKTLGSEFVLLMTLVFLDGGVITDSLKLFEGEELVKSLDLHCKSLQKLVSMNSTEAVMLEPQDILREINASRSCVDHKKCASMSAIIMPAEVWIDPPCTLAQKSSSPSFVGKCIAKPPFQPER